MSARDTAATALVDIGFTPIESEVYLALIEERAATGYRIAQTLGRAAPQIYKVIEALAKKGAVLTSTGRTRTYRAVPPDEFLSQLRTGFATRTRQVERALHGYQHPPKDDRIYSLEYPNQVYERARQMLHRCRKVAIVDVFPGPYSHLSDAIEDMQVREVAVAVKLYRPEPVKGALCVVPRNAPQLLDSWPGEVLNLAVDGTEFLSALISWDGRTVINAIWSASPFLAAREFNGLGSELGYTLLQSRLTEDDSDTSAQDLLGQLEPFRLANSPGFSALHSDPHAGSDNKP